VIVLDVPADVDEYAHVLYARLREADRIGLDLLLAVLPEPDGVGAAVCDRLTRAAAGSAP
jgi:L-threonylcarbamoyladenylate synthase